MPTLSNWEIVREYGPDLGSNSREEHGSTVSEVD